MAHPPLVQAMLDPSFYPHRPKGVELVETHISWVFLTGDLAYKVKKPVDFGFLDFRTLEQRRHFSEEEVRLNRRLSPDVYMGVVEIKERDGGFSLEGEGEVVEVAVLMRQLPKDWRLDLLLEGGRVGPEALEKVARRIASFHREARTDPYVASFGRPEKVMVNIWENFEQTEAFQGVTIPQGQYIELRDYSYRFLEERRDLLLERVEGGFIREGHGDLHAENVYLHGEELYVLDCIEFNERFRFLDTACDIAFLLMDLEARGFPSEGWRFLNAYLQFTGDYGLLEVLDFYKIYRAYVRGKIASFELSSKGPEAQQRASGYFSLAYRYLTEPRPRFLLATCGPMGSGKTTVAVELASRLGVVLIRSDALRKLSLGIDPREHRYEPFGRGIYSPEVTERTYRRMLGEAERALRAGYPVVLDASFSRRGQRQMVRELSERLRVPYLFLFTVCPEEVIRERLASRQEDLSDGRVEILREHLASFEGPEEIPEGRLVRIDTSGALDLSEVLRKVSALEEP